MIGPVRLLAVLSLVVGPMIASAHAQDQEVDPQIKTAIARGVAFLKDLQRGDGIWQHHEIGATALAALTLLECEVPANDPAIRKAAAAVRQASIDLSHTYSLALCVMFLDRLGDADDFPLIESLTVRLMAGQNANGGWTYHCPTISMQESRRLRTVVENRMKAERNDAVRAKTPERRPLSPEIQAQIRVITRQVMPPMGDDNSNTQFATLALWIARRHGLPTETSLARVDTRFRATQNPDGGWGYVATVSEGTSTMSMTCAGLLGLAVGHGTRPVLRTKPKPDAKNRPAVDQDPSKDPAVRGGLQALGTAIGNPVGRNRPAVWVVPEVDHYFLWSLERVAVAYSLKTIGNKDWYGWGSEILVNTQQPNGSWQSNKNDGVNTCFALLFLRRANLAEDLSATLRGKVKDPGEVTLKSGGVGGAMVKVIKLKPGDNPQNKPGETVAKLLVDTAPGAAANESDLDKEIARLSTEVVKAASTRQSELISKYKDSPGVVYTQALANAIHQLDGSAKSKARDALAERLVRMKAETLRGKLQDTDAEVRSAAALACGMKEDKAHVPDLIGLLNDADRRVGRAAQVALKSLTKQDFGPASDATKEERDASINAWRAWWKKQGAK